MSGLREEIIESEKTRSDLLKWKLIIVAALGTVGLGVKGSGTPSIDGAFFVLLLIPLVCFYVDLLCWHTKLRIMTIGEFLRLGLGNSAVERDYEEFVSKSTQMGPKKLNIFALEDWALEWSTWVLSVLVILAGWTLPEIRQMSGSISIMGTVVPEYTMVRGMFLVAGLAGIGLTWMARRQFKVRRGGLRELGRDREVIARLNTKYSDAGRTGDETDSE